MAETFFAPTPHLRLAELAKSARGFVAVPFIGKGAARLLPLLPGSALVTRMDETSVRAGLVHPGEIVKFIRRGVVVHNCANLHAKVYVFGRRAIVGSANLSQSSMSLMEAALKTSSPQIVSAAKSWVRELCADEVGVEYARSLLPLYPNEQENKGAR